MTLGQIFKSSKQINEKEIECELDYQFLNQSIVPLLEQLTSSLLSKEEIKYVNENIDKTKEEMKKRITKIITLKR